MQGELAEERQHQWEREQAERRAQLERELSSRGPHLQQELHSLGLCCQLLDDDLRAAVSAAAAVNHSDDDSAHEPSNDSATGATVALDSSRCVACSASETHHASKHAILSCALLQVPFFLAVLMLLSECWRLFCSAIACAVSAFRAQLVHMHDAVEVCPVLLACLT